MELKAISVLLISGDMRQLFVFALSAVATVQLVWLLWSSSPSTPPPPLSPPPPEPEVDLDERPPQPTSDCRPQQQGLRPLIHLPLSVTSRNLPRLTHIKELPLLKHALRTLASSAEPDLFDYDIGIGADQGDEYYDNSTYQVAIQEWWQHQWREHWAATDYCVPPLWFVIYDNTQSRNTWAVNYVTQRAYEQGADWFMRVNDDTEFFNNHWSSAFVNELQSFRPIPGLGVTGPWDDYQKGKLLTHSMVGRLHFDVFGFHFPFTLGNWWSDDWVQKVYAPPYNSTVFGANATMMSILKHVPVKHVFLKSRYTVKSTEALYMKQLLLDRELLRLYVEKTIRHVPRLSSSNKI